jgi:DNA-binding response OmpR family regulator
MNVLVVEDDLISRKVLAAQLRKLGHEVEEAVDGEEAWSKLGAQKFAVVITDWMMPRVDGLELCRRVRAAGPGPYVYIIMVTAIERMAGFVEGMEAGADDFVTKPCSSDELQVRLRVAERIIGLQYEALQLEGLLPICPKCSKIETKEKTWQPVESYIMKTTEAQFSHGVCPSCYEKHMKPQLEAYQKKSVPG